MNMPIIDTKPGDAMSAIDPIAEMKAELAALRADVEALKAAVPSASSAKGKEKDCLEIVAVPDAGVSAPEDLVFDGERCLKREVDGFTHFKVPRKHAEELLTLDWCGRYLLIGDAPNKAMRRKGVFSEEVEIQPHVLGKDGAWVPVRKAGK